MVDKFQVYVQVRATRQLAGDVASSIKLDWNNKDEDGMPMDWHTKKEWDKIESLLNEVESKLEKMNLK